MQGKFPEIYVQYIGVIFVTFLLIGFIITLLLVYQKRKLVQENELISIKSAFDMELLQTKIEIQENVLTNVSLEIHDNIGQIMLLANVNMSIVQQMPLPDGAIELIGETKRMLSKASEDISQLSRSLNADRIVQLGVFRSILTELEILKQKNLFIINIVDGAGVSGVELSKEAQLLVFRMFQEIISNIIKHSKATKVTIQIESLVNGYSLKIADNGIGFQNSPAADGISQSNGLGLRSLTERARLFNGSIGITSALQKGTHIDIFIPIA